jgi:type III pantothenate kinase
MLLAIDIGNSNIVFGLFEQDALLHKFRIETDLEKSVDNYAVDILELFLNQKIDCLQISTAIISSVVPNLTKTIEDAVEKFCGGTILNVGKNIKPNIEIEINNKAEVGQDRLINAIAAYAKHGGDLIVVDFGTATTFDVIGPDGQYLGGIISPGVNLSIKALHDMTAQLPKIHPKAQKNVIGKSTFEAMNSGIYFGYISMVEGLVAKIEAEYGKKMNIVITGGLAPLFCNAISNQNVEEPNLTLEGLRMVAAAQ